jgi:hypothetical protein
MRPHAGHKSECRGVRNRSGLLCEFQMGFKWYSTVNAACRGQPDTAECVSLREGPRYNPQQLQCAYNVTLRRVRETTVAVEKQYLLHISVFVLVRVGACVCVCVGVGARARACAFTRVAILIRYNILLCTFFSVVLQDGWYGLRTIWNPARNFQPNSL